MREDGDMTILNQPYGMIGSNGKLLQFDGVKYSLLVEGLTGISHYPVSHDSTATPGNDRRTVSYFDDRQTVIIVCPDGLRREPCRT